MKTHQMMTLRLPVELHDAVVERAQQEDLNMAQVIRRALRLYLARKPPEGL